MRNIKIELTDGQATALTHFLGLLTYESLEAFTSDGAPVEAIAGALTIVREALTQPDYLSP